MGITKTDVFVTQVDKENLSQLKKEKVMDSGLAVMYL